jgi:hypothetical protein
MITELLHFRVFGVAADEVDVKGGLRAYKITEVGKH